MKNRTILTGLILLLILSACNPCKRISKYEYCFPPDTVKENKTTVKYEKVFITEDSVIYETVECDSVTNTAEVEQVYKTIWKIKVDTIYRSRTEAKVNPVNTQLKKSVEKLNKKIIKKTQLNKIYLGIIIVFLIIVVLYFIIKKFI